MMNVMDIWFVVKTIVGEMELDLPDLPIAANHLRRLLDQKETETQMLNGARMNCSTMIGKQICPNTCKEAEYVPNSDAEWCNDIDCSTFVAKIVCNDTCKQRGH